MTKQIQSTDRTTPRRDQWSGDLDPAKLGATLHELAYRVHRFVRAIERPGSGLKTSQQELTALHAELFRLQSKYDSQQLDSLAKYASAMRERLEHACPELFRLAESPTSSVAGALQMLLRKLLNLRDAVMTRAPVSRIARRATPLLVPIRVGASADGSLRRVAISESSSRGRYEPDRWRGVFQVF
jgi:septal ring factor EnvC (AmiA/AmiB activator)